MTTLAWREPCFGADLHLAAGLSGPRLDQRLSVDFGAASVRGDELPGYDEVTRLRFSFPDATPADAWSGIGTDQATGRVWLSSSMPATGERRVYYFVVTVTLIVTAGGAEEAVADPLFLQVWSHTGVDEVWLTPDGLTAHQGSDPVRFSLLARFSDGMVADVSNWSPAADGDLLDFVHHGDPAVAAVSWTVPQGSRRLDLTARTGRFSARRSGGTAIVQASLDTGGADPPPAVATVHLTHGWDTRVDVSWVEGAGTAFAQRVPNVLFLPDGWPQDAEQEFGHLVACVVRNLTQGEYFSPYDLMRDSVNYFRAFVPSRQAGITVLPQVGINYQAATAAVSKDPPTAPALMAQVTATVPAQWPVSVLDEVDSAFGCATGERPRARPTTFIREIGLNPWRVSDADFDTFLRALHCPDVPDIGSRWTSGGADQDLIVVIALSATGAGTGSRRYVADGDQRSYGGRTAILTTAIEQNGPMALTAIGDRYTVRAPAGAAGIDLTRLTAVIAHEFSHCLGVGDEYGGAVQYQHPTVDQIREYPNLEPQADTIGPAAQAFGSVRWQWPRIGKSGVLSAPASVSGTPLTPDDPTWPAGGSRVRVSLAPDPAAAPGPGTPATAFGVGDLVRLRTRPLGIAATSARYRVTAVSTQDPPEGATAVVELAPETGAASVIGGDWIDKVMGSMLIKVTVDADDPESGDVGLVHRLVMAHMADSHAPLRLHQPSDEAGGAVWLAPDNPPPTGTFTSLPAIPGKLVGLYEGGFGENSGVYHPAGGCLMRRSPHDTAGFAAAAFAGLCAVCRYIVTDRFDPMRHAAVDRRYDTDYPR